MTLDEAIIHCEEVAESQEKKARKLNDGTMSTRIKCEECAKEHRQLAEWLKELKAYRKAKEKILENMKVWADIYTEPLEWNVEDINSIKLAFYQDGKGDAYTDCIGICEIAFEEVKADADSD